MEGRAMAWNGPGMKTGKETCVLVLMIGICQMAGIYSKKERGHKRGVFAYCIAFTVACILYCCARTDVEQRTGRQIYNREGYTGGKDG